MEGNGGHKVILTWTEASCSEELGRELYLGPGKHLTTARLDHM